MENASKALLMAGGVLIAIIIISLLVKTYGNIGKFQKQQLSAEEAEQIEEFNKNYTKYQGQYIYGTEVITVINRVLKEKEKSGEEIKVYITFGEAYTYNVVTYVNGKKTTKERTVSKHSILEINNDDDVGRYSDSSFIDERNNKNALDDLKQRAFKCTKVGYDNSTGRVNEIRFEEKQYSDET